MGGMEKTTLYLPSALKAAVKRAARERHVSEAEVIRDALRATVVEPARPRPRGGFLSGGPPIAADVDPHLEGFGER